MEQINVEYKQRALECHPDKHPEPENVAKFQLLQEAKSILTDGEKRKSYDKWLNSGVQTSFHKWNSLQGQSTMHWVKKVPTKPGIEFGSKSKVEWESDSPNETLRKFRNYDI